jgi:hypothetical protein
VEFLCAPFVVRERGWRGYHCNDGCRPHTLQQNATRIHPAHADTLQMLWGAGGRNKGLIKVDKQTPPGKQACLALIMGDAPP